MPKRASIWAWFWVILVGLYFFVPLYATFRFSLQAKRGELGFTAYTNVLQAPDFIKSFTFSLQTALITILVSTLLIVPTAYWVQLKLPRARSLIEFFTLLPFVIPAVVLVFGLIRAYNGSGLTDSSRGIYIIMVVIGLTSWAGVARLVRGEFLAQSVRDRAPPGHREGLYQRPRPRLRAHGEVA